MKVYIYSNSLTNVHFQDELNSNCRSTSHSDGPLSPGWAHYTFEYYSPLKQLTKLKINAQQTRGENYKWYLKRNKVHVATFSAWTTVLGNPSRRNPFAHSGLPRLSSISSTTRASLTSWKCGVERIINNKTYKVFHQTLKQNVTRYWWVMCHIASALYTNHHAAMIIIKS